MKKNINKISVGNNVCVSSGRGKETGNAGFNTSFYISSKNANIKTVMAESDEDSLNFFDRAFSERSNEKIQNEINPTFEVFIKSKNIFI